jgi:hypothetical protein
MLSKSDWPFETNHPVQLSQMESVNMRNQNSAIQLAAIAVNEGSKVIWSTTSREYPNFEIDFVGSAPPSAGDDLSGSVSDPVTIVVTAEDVGNFTYNIKHIKHDKTFVTTGPFPFSVRGCPGCEGAVTFHLPTDQAVNQSVADQATADQAAMAIQ